MLQLKTKLVVFESVFANDCRAFIDYKRALGYKYMSEEGILKRFDTLCVSLNHSEKVLTKKLVEMYTALKPVEAPKSRALRASVMREFALYQRKRGGVDFLLPPGKQLISQFSPYIFTTDEIRRFLCVADNMSPTPLSPNAHIVYPLLFKVLYCCGLRISEALNLKREDADLNNGVLLIKNSKFEKERVIVMSKTLTEACCDYAVNIHTGHDYEYFFPAHDGGFIHKNTVYCKYRILLWKAGISHGGRGKGPRLHDLRHTFAVHCLNNWVKNGRDAYVLLPSLCTYLGHSKITKTEQYLRLVPEMHGTIIVQSDTAFPNIIPTIPTELWEVE